MTIAGVLGWDKCTLPGLMAPCGKFVALMMDLNLYHWDVRNKGNARTGFIEHLEMKAKSPFSDLDTSDNVSVREIPEESVSLKKCPALPVSEDQSAFSSSDDSDYEMDNGASLEQCPARKLPARKSHPVGSFSEE